MIMIMVLLMTRRLNACSILISVILAQELSRNLCPAKIKMLVMMLTMMVLLIRDGRPATVQNCRAVTGQK